MCDNGGSKGAGAMASGPAAVKGNGNGTGRVTLTPDAKVAVRAEAGALRLFRIQSASGNFEVVYRFIV